MEEMIGYDPDEVREDNIFIETKTDIPATRSGLEQSAHTDKVAFLKLMVRMRRVIIQDAVLCLQPEPGTGRILSNSLIEKLPEIFQSQLFLEYSKDLLLAIEQHRETSGALAAGIHVDDADFIEVINRSASQQTVLDRTLAAMEVKHQKQLAQQHERHTQAMAVEMAQYTRLQEAHEGALTTLKEFKEIRQQLLLQYSQHPPFHPPPSQHPDFHPQPSQPSQPSQQPRFDPQPLHLHASYKQHQQQTPQPLFNYIMRPDKGAWTLRNAWDEYHGPLARAYADSHKTWGENQKRQYRRRTELIELIRKKAASEAKTIDSILACKDYTGMSVNAVKELLKTESSKTAVTTMG